MSEHEHAESRLERAADSSMAKVAARVLVPALLPIIGSLLIVLAVQQREDMAALTSDQREQGKDIVAIKSDVRDVNTRLDAQVLRQVETNTQVLQAHERRLQQLERAVRVP
jgi:hypothetical protein